MEIQKYTRMLDIQESMDNQKSNCEYHRMDDLRLYVLFNSISVITGPLEFDNERLCATELRLRLERFRLERGWNSVR